jgi:hypothetical protein
MNFLYKLRLGEFGIVKTLFIFGIIIFSILLVLWSIFYTYIGMNIKKDPIFYTSLLITVQGIFSIYGYLWLTGIRNAFKKEVLAPWLRMIYQLLASFLSLIVIMSFLGLLVKIMDYIQLITS